MLVYFCKKLLLPWRRGETALALDKEKMQFFVTRKTVYWKDVDYINTGGTQRGLEIKFAIKGSSKDVTINTQYVAGKDNEISQTIKEYFEKYKT